MYFSHIPNDIDKYETHEKKKVFLSVLLPIALRGNELVLQERKLIEAIFKKIIFIKLSIFQRNIRSKTLKKLSIVI